MGGTARGVVLATALTTRWIRPAELGELRRWHADHADEIQAGGRSTLLGGLYGGEPARGWIAGTARTAAALNPEGTGAMISLPVDQGIARQVAQPDGEPVEAMHLTLFHLGGDATALPPDLRPRIAHTLTQAASQAPAAPITLTHVERFTAGDEGLEPVVLVTDHPAVYELRAQLKDALDAAGIVYSENHAFRCHLTLGYYAPGDGPEAGPVEESLGQPLEGWTPTEVELHWGPNVDAFPLAASTPEQPMTAAAAPRPRPPHPTAKRLARLSAQVSKIDRSTVTKLHAGATLAYADALRRAGVKLRTRASRTRSGAKMAAVDAAQGSYPPALLAAVGITEQELLDHAFDTYKDQATAIIAAGERKKLRAAAVAAGVDPDQLERDWDERVDDRAERGAGFIAAGLGMLARAALSGSAPHPAPTVGEYSGPVPFGLVRNGWTIGATGTAAPVIDESGPGAHGNLDDLSRKLIDVGSSAVQEILGETLKGDGETVFVETSTWSHGDPDRPLQGHLDLDEVSWQAGGDYPPELYVTDEDSWLDREMYEPGDHAGCFPVGTVVSGPAAIGSTLRWYEGRFVKLTLASGELLTATANHPVLTPDGWVAAGLLSEGDDVIRCVDAEAVTGLVPGEYQVPAPIEDVTAAVGVADGVVPRAVVVPPEYFHGDGVGSEVAVVRTNRDLGAEHQPAGGEPFGKLAFAGRDPDPARLSGRGTTTERLESVGHSAFRGVGGGRDTHALLRGAARRDFSQDVGDGALRHARFLEAIVDDDTTHPELRREALDGLTGLVATDQVIDVERYSSAAHVFNLQTRPGWYLAANILVHNCTCMIDTSYEPSELGASAGDSSAGDSSGGDAVMAEG